MFRRKFAVLLFGALVAAALAVPALAAPGADAPAVQPTPTPATSPTPTPGVKPRIRLQGKRRGAVIRRALRQDLRLRHKAQQALRRLQARFKSLSPEERAKGLRILRDARQDIHRVEQSARADAHKVLEELRAGKITPEQAKQQLRELGKNTLAEIRKILERTREDLKDLGHQDKKAGTVGPSPGRA